jgi:nicotinamide mononucleotide transporter
MYARLETMTRTEDFKDVAISLIFAAIATGLSYIVGFTFHWIDSVSWTEAFGAYTGYSCTYLCVKQSEWNYPIGILCVIVLGFFFLSINLLSSAILQFYLIPVLIIGWIHWGKEKTNVPVVHVNLSWNTLFHLVGAIATYLVLWNITSRLGASMAYSDSAILVFSILAQYTMQAKKLENWWIWVLVNIISIYTYLESGAFVLGVQYILFIATDLTGLVSWSRDMKKTRFA